jgi:hypothetical protein
VKAEDDTWAEDYDRYDSRDANRYGQAASEKATYKSSPGGYGSYG